MPLFSESDMSIKRRPIDFEDIDRRRAELDSLSYEELLEKYFAPTPAYEEW